MLFLAAAMAVVKVPWSVPPAVDVAASTAPLATLCSLVVVRSQSAWSRWYDASDAMGDVATCLRDLQRMALFMQTDRFAALAVCFAYALRARLADDDDDDASRESLLSSLTELIGPRSAADVVNDDDRPIAVVRAMTTTASDLPAPLRARVDARLDQLVAHTARCDTLLQPKSKRFVGRLCVAFVPIAGLVAHANLVPVIFGSAAALFLLRQLDRLAAKIDQPFVGLDDFCAQLKRDYDVAYLKRPQTASYSS